MIEYKIKKSVFLLVFHHQSTKLEHSMKPLIIFLILFLHANSQLQINWVKCNVTFTASKATDIFPNSFPWNPTGNSDKIDTSDILCAYIKVPLFWSKPTGPKITFHIYKKPSKSANKKGQLVR